MPTLCFDSEDEISEGKETASPGEMAWIAANYAQNNPATQNDSTLSGTFLEEALVEMQKQKQKQQHTSAENTQYSTMNRHDHRSPELSSAMRDVDTQNDSTMSEGFLDEVLEKASKSQRASSTGSVSPKYVSDTMIGRSPTGQSHQALHASQPSKLSQRTTSIQSSILRDDDISYELDASPSRHHVMRERPKGHNEMLYLQQYKSKMDSIIAKMKLRHPGTIRDYREMNDNEKGDAQQMVTSLLSRLRIHNGDNASSSQQSKKLSQPSLNSGQARSTQDDSFGVSQLEHHASSSSHSSRKYDDHTKNTTADQTNADQTTLDVSKALLSPENMEESKELSSPGNVSEEKKEEHDSPMAFPDDDNSSILHDQSKALLTPNDHSTTLLSPLNKRNSEHEAEHARSYVQYSSPAFHGNRHESFEGNKKRLASRSAKREGNLSRLRFSREYDESPDVVMKNLSRLSISPVPNFPNSQSPILQEETPMRDGSSRSVASISFGDDAAHSPGNFSPSPSPRYKSSRDSLVSFPYSTRPPLQNVSHNVELKEGATFHYDPLETEFSSAKDNSSYPDPLHRYPKNVRSLLRLFYKAISCLLQKEPRSGIVFTLTDSQILDMTLRLLLRGKSLPSQPTVHHELGSTLIVVRDKDWAEAYGRALREGSALSVLNHCTLPQKERRSPSNIHRFAKYGVVLTTYDALKSKDLTLHVDKAGMPISSSASSQNDWQSSRNGSQRSEAVAQFSILHQIHWQRIVLVDAVGRKSYLAKSDTSRYKAVKSISSDCRLIFFTELDSKHSALEMLLRSDRKALSGMCALTRLAEPNWNELALEELIVEADDFC